MLMVMYAVVGDAGLMRFVEVGSVEMSRILCGLAHQSRWVLGLRSLVMAV
jgi:hypothetical protein